MEREESTTSDNMQLKNIDREEIALMVRPPYISSEFANETMRMEIVRNSSVILWKPVDELFLPCNSHALMVKGERQRSTRLSGWMSYLTFILIVINNFIAQEYKIASKAKKEAETIKFEDKNIIGIENIVTIINNIKEKRREERYFFMGRFFSDESFCSNREGMESWGEKKFSS